MFYHKVLLKKYFSKVPPKPTDCICQCFKSLPARSKRWYAMTMSNPWRLWCFLAVDHFLHGFLLKSISGLGCRGPSSSGAIWKWSLLGSMPWAGMESRAEQWSQAGWLCSLFLAEESVHCVAAAAGAPGHWDQWWQQVWARMAERTPIPLWRDTRQCHRGTWVLQLPSHLAVCIARQCQQRSGKPQMSRNFWVR